jgi:sugar phosphate isomerase/epimerase
MHYGISLWNFARPGGSLVELIDRFAAMGFDTVSFLPRQLLEMDAGRQRELSRLLRRRTLAATVHGPPDIGPEDAERVIAALGEALLAFTFDAAKQSGPQGGSLDAERMAALLMHVERCSRGSELRFGVEDFPLDRQTLDRHRAALTPLTECPHFGVLVDVGHMNIALRKEGGAPGQRAADFLAAVPLPIIEVHLHDNDGTCDSHLPLGDGSVPFDDVAIGLQRAGFKGIATIEIAPALHGAAAEEEMPRVAEGLDEWQQAWQRARRSTPN